MLVGVDGYHSTEIQPLNHCVNGAKQLGQFLENSGFKVLQLLDGDATKEAIEDCLGDSLKWKVGANDRVLVYFSGQVRADKAPGIVTSTVTITITIATIFIVITNITNTSTYHQHDHDHDRDNHYPQLY